jgi:beta-xylosidase
MDFIELNQGRPIFQAPATLGNGLARDPSVELGSDNRFHMVWTSSWWQGDHFGIAHSDDLLSWSPAEKVLVHHNEPTALNVWAPEIFFDESNARYQVMFASTVRRIHPDGTSEKAPDEKGAEHRQYVVTTTDFNEWSPTELFFDQGFSVIDAMIARQETGDYAMVIKDETLIPQATKNMKLVFSDSAMGPWSTVSASITPDNTWTESPSLNKIGEHWFVYFDAYAEGGYGAMRSADLKVWENISNQMSLPSGIRHGTVISVAQERVQHLLTAHW